MMVDGQRSKMYREKIEMPWTYWMCGKGIFYMELYLHIS